MRKLATVALVAIAASCTPSTPTFSLKYAEKRGTIDKNGLRFVVVPDSTTQMVEVDVRYDVGSREDPPGKAGLAHLVEHMMFQQRPDGPQTPPLMHFIDQLTTFFNAFTEWDKTHYMQLSRADMLDSMLKIEAMRMFYGCQTVEQGEFERELEVVRNEIRWRGGDAQGQAQQMVLSSVYPKGHAYEREIGGNDRQLAGITLKDACEFMQKYYTPDRAVVVVAGGVDVEAAEQSIQKWFGNMARRTPAPRVEVAPITMTPGRAQFEVDVERPQVYFAWALPPHNTPEGEAAQFGIWGTFFNTAAKAQEYGFATQVTPQLLGGQLAPVFVIGVELKDMGKLDEAIDFVTKAARQAGRGYDQMDYEALTNLKARRKAKFIADIEPLTQRTLQIAEAVQFDKEMSFGSSDEYIIHELKKIDEFSGDRVRDAVTKALDPSKVKIIVIKNTKEGVHGDVRAKMGFQTKSDEKKELAEVDPREALRPLKVAAELKALNGARRFELGNGMKVVLLPIDAMPLVATELTFRVGTSTAPGVADAAASFLSLPMDALAVQAAGLNVGCEAGADTTVCATGGVNIYLDVMINSLERLVTAGEYSQEGIEQYAKSYADRMKLKETQTEFEFTRQTLGALYGAEHPYTKGAAVPASVFGNLGRDKLTSFRNAHYTAGNATLVIAGNFDPDKAEKMVRGAFSGWGRGSVDKPVSPDLRPRTGPEYIGVVGKDEPQTAIRIMYPAPAGVDGQEAARRVLGQMLNERMEDIRFKLGSTYGTYARHSNAVGPNSYGMGGDVDTARTGESLKAMRAGIAVLQHVAAGTATDDELSMFAIDFVRARRKLVQVLLGESTVSEELARRLGFIAVYNLPPDFYNQLLQRTAAVSLAQLKMLITSELAPENEIIVTKGSRETIEKTFSEAGLTSVKIVEPEYK
jgi:zinc protease